MWLLSDPRMIGPFLAALCAVACTAAQAATVQCPATHEGHPYVTFGLFGGRMEDQAELRPEGHVYRIPHKPAGWDKPFPDFKLVCFYRGADAALDFILPAGIDRCIPTKGAPVWCE